MDIRRTKPCYPRPLLKRAAFLSLDGTWTMNGREIRVPFPPQAPLSGWQGEVPEEMVYEKTFDLPGDWTENGGRILLHFGAVDQEARVTLNGTELGAHEGGYLPFSFDITGAVRPRDNRLTVYARDTLSHRYPYGKQTKKPHGMWYTPVSGIWQTVWLEPVPAEHILSLRADTDLDSVTLTVNAAGAAEAEVLIDGLEPVICPVNVPTRIPIPSPRLWSPSDPYLYHFTVTLGRDRAESRFGLRTVGTEALPDGTERLTLNGEPLFLFGILDQGYWPDGLFLPDDPSEYEKELDRASALGINLIRKHIKIEPEAFYDACDRKGILVLQDMVNSGPYHYILDTVLPTVGFKYRPGCLPGSRRRRAFFEKHCLGTQDRLHGHPSVIGYTIFNEGWGQYDTSRIYRALKKNDPTRFYLSASGWFKGYQSDIEGEHIYFKEKILKRRKRPLMISECGGFTLDSGTKDTEHKTYGYGQTASPEELTARIEQMFDNMVLPSARNGLNGVVYTQLTDVEGEINGLYTYDRTICKVLPDRIRALAERCSDTFFKALEKARAGEPTES